MVKLSRLWHDMVIIEFVLPWGALKISSDAAKAGCLFPSNFPPTVFLDYLFLDFKVCLSSLGH